MLVCCLALLTTQPEEFLPKDSFVVDNDESIPKREWTPGPQTGQQEQFETISPVPSSINLSTPLPRPPSNGHFTPQLEQSDYPANEGWRWQEDIRAWADCHHVLSPMGFKRQNSPVPRMPREQTLRQPTPGPSGTRWLEDSSCKPSQHDEPPIPGPSPSSKPPEDVSTCEPEPEVAQTQSMEESFVPPRTPPPPPLIPTIMLARNLPTLMIPQAIVHESINQISLEHCHLLHMIPFVDAPGIPGGTKQPPSPGTGGL
ncbi:hypothetical protein O181_054008 [Austropuccinia psidii MF-1]|uniref:Uncharacterized protein n=1 Tax=Austropuccinia psidii MF-1 TaxID=1389203 RepID=A0A9Q3E5G5_9BASI|nr:hypothetical protein [Austropuccinia psidii MF-1]